MDGPQPSPEHPLHRCALKPTLWGGAYPLPWRNHGHGLLNLSSGRYLPRAIMPKCLTYKTRI
jgi:hypothetical protein